MSINNVSPDSIRVVLVVRVKADGGNSVLIMVYHGKQGKRAVKSTESVDPKVFLTIKSSIPFRGFRYGARE